jgi:hypothetical protein
MSGTRSLPKTMANWFRKLRFRARHPSPEWVRQLRWHRPFPGGVAQRQIHDLEDRLDLIVVEFRAVSDTDFRPVPAVWVYARREKGDCHHIAPLTPCRQPRARWPKWVIERFPQRAWRKPSVSSVGHNSLRSGRHGGMVNK